MRVLVTGAGGLLGSELVRLAGHDVIPTYHSQPVPGGVRLDVRRLDEVHALMRSVRPDAIIHTAYRQDDWASTADGAVHVALAAEGARLVFVSSDAVFGGREAPYDEAELPCPNTPYGAAKAAAETAVRALVPDAVVARTSLIVSSTGASGEEQRTRNQGTFFRTNIRCPVHVTDLATALLEILTSTITGIVHLGGPEALSRLELGRLIARRDDLDPAALRFVPGTPSTIVLDSRRTQCRLRTRLRAPSEFLSRR